jgi:hypothetical protein
MFEKKKNWSRWKRRINIKKKSYDLVYEIDERGVNDIVM